MVTGGANLGRIGVITNRERHPGSFDVVHVKDANGNSFATRLSNIFVIGKVRGFSGVEGEGFGLLPTWFHRLSGHKTGLLWWDWIL